MATNSAPFPTSGESPYGPKVKTYIDTGDAAVEAAAKADATTKANAAKADAATDATSKVSSHTSAADPHTQYQTRAAHLYTGNLDSLIWGGDYAIGAAASNAPFTGGGHLTVIEGIGNYRAQIMIGREASNQTNFWRRIRVSTTWLNWQRVTQENAANTFSAPQLFSANVVDQFAIERPSNGPDVKRWAHYVDTSGSYHLVNRADDGTNLGIPFSLRKDGSVSIGGIHEITGTGNPNGVHVAPVGSVFRNTEVGGWNGARVWRKDSGTGSSGWVVESGDTGWRNITSTLTFPGVTYESGTFSVRRTENQLFYRFVQLKRSGGDGTAAYLQGIPAGFTAPTGGATITVRSPVSSGVNEYTVLMTSGATLYVMVSYGSIGTAASGQVAEGKFLSGNAHFPAEPNVWPTTLPGTPA